MPTINIKGPIISNDSKWVYDYFGMESVCPRDVLQGLEACTTGEAVKVIISSSGGDIVAATEIYDALRNYCCDVQIKVVTAASAATIIACAGQSEIVPTALFMIHNVSSYAEGDYNEMDKQSRILQTANRAVAAAYKLKTGKNEDELLDLMNKETWMTAKEAVENGFIDKISEAKTSNNQPKNLQLAASINEMIPPSIIANLQNQRATIRTKLQLLKIKEEVK